MSVKGDVQKLIKGEALIRVSRVEKSSEINKRACPVIRHLGVLYYAISNCQIYFY